MVHINYNHRINRKKNQDGEFQESLGSANIEREMRSYHPVQVRTEGASEVPNGLENEDRFQEGRDHTYVSFSSWYRTLYLLPFLR